MKKFDLEAAKNGAKIVCRDSTITARILCTDMNHPHYPLVVAFQHIGCDEISSSAAADGKYNSGGSACQYDLFMAPTIKSAWVNIYLDSTRDIFVGVQTFKTEGEAIKKNDPKFGSAYIGPYFIEVEV